MHKIFTKLFYKNCTIIVQNVSQACHSRQTDERFGHRGLRSPRYITSSLSLQIFASLSLNISLNVSLPLSTNDCSRSFPLKTAMCVQCPDLLRETVINVSLTLSVISVGVLVSALILFSMFDSIQCRRLSIHKNLAMAFVLRFAVLAIWTVVNTSNAFRDCTHFNPIPLRNWVGASLPPPPLPLPSFPSAGRIA